MRGFPDPLRCVAALPAATRAHSQRRHASRRCGYHAFRTVAIFVGARRGAEAGVARALQLLQAELVLDMQLAGVTSVSEIGPGLVASRR